MANQGETPPGEKNGEHQPVTPVTSEMKAQSPAFCRVREAAHGSGTPVIRTISYDDGDDSSDEEELDEFPVEEESPEFSNEHESEESHHFSVEEERTRSELGGPIFANAYSAFRLAKRAFREVEEGLKGTDKWLMRKADGGNERVQLLRKNYNLECKVDTLQERISLLEKTESEQQNELLQVKDSNDKLLERLKDAQNKQREDGILITWLEKSESKKRKKLRHIKKANKKLIAQVEEARENDILVTHLEAEISCKMEGLQERIKRLQNTQSQRENLRIAQLETSETELRDLNNKLIVEIIRLNKQKEACAKMTQIFLGQRKQALEKEEEKLAKMMERFVG